MPESFKSFLKSAKKQLKQNQFQIGIGTLQANKKIESYYPSENDGEAQGIFCPNLKIFYVRKNADWQNTFFHEYAHFLQWQNGEPFNFSPWINNWLKGNGDFPKKNYTHALKIEMEAENAALSLVRKFGGNEQIFIESANNNILHYVFHLLMNDKTTKKMRNTYNFFFDEVNAILPKKIMDRKWISKNKNKLRVLWLSDMKKPAF